jgi:protein tyrosine/serine phosphatase
MSLTALGLFWWHSSYFRLTANFYEVDPGKFYRSAQLTPLELQEVISAYGIKTVVSLRGAPEDSFWFKPQVELLKRLGIDFVTIGWTSHYLPSEEELNKYVDVLKNAARPILIHCRSGADRTGEATAIYILEKMQTQLSKEEIIEQSLNWRFYHFETLHPAKKKLVRDWQGMDWAQSSYKRCTPEHASFVEPNTCGND